jgi:iron complex outermembrane receptor protein
MSKNFERRPAGAGAAARIPATRTSGPCASIVRVPAACALLLGLAPAALSAQVRPDSAAADSARRARALNPVVTTATRDARQLQRVPVSISVVDSSTIARTNTVGLAEALRTVPGVIAGNLFGSEDARISIRGSGARGGFGVRGVGILLDGVPVTDPDGQTRLDQLDLGAARSIEVVRGPGGAMYGGAASGGVINVITKSGREAPGLTLRLTGGGFGPDSLNLRKADVAWGGARGAWDAYVQGSLTDLAGFRVQGQNAVNRANMRLNWTRLDDAGRSLDATRATRVGLEVAWSDLDMRIPGSLVDGEWNSMPWRADSLNIVGDYARREERWRAGLRLSQGLGTRLGTLEAFAFGTARTIDHPIFRVVDQNTHRAQLGVRHAVDLRVPSERDGFTARLSTGVDADRWYGDSRQWTNVGGRQGRQTPCVNIPAAGISSVPCVDQYVTLPGFGAYTQLDLSRGRWNVTAGGRYDQVTYDIEDRIRPSQSVNRSFDQFSPRLAVRYDVRPGTSVYASVARGFEVPTNAELTASPDTLTGFNTTLRPSTLVNYEVGAKALLAGRVLVDAAAFLTDVEGEFLSRTVVIPGVAFPRTIFENVGRTERTGFELSTTTFVTSWLDLVGSYTYSRFIMREFTGTAITATGASVAEDYAGKRVPGVPAHRLAVEARLRPTSSLALTVWGEAQSRTFVDNANTVDGTVFNRVTRQGAPPLIVPVAFRAAPGFALAHATLTWQLPGWRDAGGAPRAQLFAQADNLFDARYVAAVSTNAGNGRFYFPGMGRVVNLGLTLSTGGR